MNNDDEHGPIKNESACNYDEEKGAKTPPNASEPLKLEGTDNYGRPRQLFADKLAAASNAEYLTCAEQYIWLSAYAASNPRSDYHWMCDACYAEAQRREKPELYTLAHKRASGTE